MGAGASSGVPCEEEIGAELQRREMVAIATNCPLNPSDRKLVDYLIYEALPYATLIMLNHDDQTASMNAIASGYEELGNHIEESLHELRTKLTGKRGGV